MSVVVPPNISEIIAMAWCDKTSFNAIATQTGLSEKQVITLMRQNLKPSSFRLWRARVGGRAAKHNKPSANHSSIDDAD
jgi:uncharacterized protein (TIGR03643 family)